MSGDSEIELPRAICTNRLLVPAELTAAEREQMFALMADYYQDVAWGDFERDLLEKEWAIVMGDARGRIRGFTTMMRLRVQVAGQPVVALFSGDTILDRDAWGAGNWTRVWGRHAGKLMQEMHGEPLYWLLLTATHRTYRFLPTFLQEFYPRRDRAMPAEMRARMDTLASAKFGAAYDAASGVVSTHRPMAVREEHVDLATAGVDDEDGLFFAARNPRYLSGDYLVCIGDLSPANQTRLGRRFFSVTEDSVTGESGEAPESGVGDAYGDAGPRG